jgi:hypothetical protein
VIVFDLQTERFQHQLTMLAADLMTNRAINVAAGPTRFWQKLCERGRARGDPFMQQFFAVGIHHRLHTSAGGVVIAATEVVKLGSRRRDGG